MSEKNKYRLILFVCVILSCAGILYSAFVSKDPLDGTRGGVLAVGLAVSYLVVERDTAGQVFDILQEHADSEIAKDLEGKLASLNRKFEDLHNWLRSKNEDEESLNWYLVTATMIATLAAAFGDLLAKGLIPHR
jgi:hypothetical protein